MRVVLVAFGTRGDVQPMLSLAQELGRRGHEAVLCAPKLFGEWISGEGVRWIELGIDPRELLSAAKSLSRMRALFLSDVARQFEVLTELVPGADLLVSGSVALAAQSVAEKAGVRFVSVAYCPATYPSEAHPFPPLGSAKLPRWARRLSWSLGTWVYARMTLPALNQHRVKHGLARDRSPLRHMFGDDALLASDPLLGEAPPDAPVAIEQTGAWLHPGKPLSAELEAFLSAGPPPVYVGFGSNPDDRPNLTTELLLEGVKRAGVRAVISVEAPENAEVPDSILFVRDVSHAQLFPRCSLVVHHGGAGTTHAAAIAGVPQWIAAGLNDQFFWGQQATALGLGPAWIRRKQLSASTLENVLREGVDAEARSRCAALASRMRRDGVSRAADSLERRSNA